MQQIYEIAAITAYIRNLIERDHILGDVWVQGEISDITRAASGHWYFTLKDDKAQLSCVMWRSDSQRQSFVPMRGDMIKAHGRLGVYEVRGDYQLYADYLERAGVGNLHVQFEMLKAQLDAEGLFADARKKRLPFFPRKIGVVTSADAAAFRDIQNVLRRRFPIAPILLSPTLVQGESAPPQIASAIQRLDASRQADVIIVARGGGSIEDLWAFNDERVARAVFQAQTPIISGVGHETDFTIIDFVADKRAPTPSAAAELATPNLVDLRAAVREQSMILEQAVARGMDIKRENLARQNRLLSLVSPTNAIQNLRQRVDDLNTRLINRQQQQLMQQKERLKAKAAALEAASPQAILKRGYAIVTHDESGEIVRHVADAPPAASITLTLHDGKLKAKVEESNE